MQLDDIANTMRDIAAEDTSNPHLLFSALGRLGVINLPDNLAYNPAATLLHIGHQDFDHHSVAWWIIRAQAEHNLGYTTTRAVTVADRAYPRHKPQESN